MMKAGKTIFAILIAGFILIQIVPVKLTNPPVESDIQTPPEVKAILKNSCYDCHSHETVWPWYSRVAPVSWLLASDANGARKRMDFSAWNRYTPEKQAVLISDIVDIVKEGDMPPLPYTWMHAGSKMTPDKIKVLEAWAAGYKKAKPVKGN
ncbi:MAG TPA: heme-binding domain-containing protein [Desulfomonilia bacterium]|nr:heme-binding domain-containing protein [Desulfomonilia bacterium]